ncbi:MAG TPA: hypothetical protein VE993_17760, partial [Stellaceae bacterium]|nr:hypothetical protein [Stellaceae bacterium]
MKAGLAHVRRVASAIFLLSVLPAVGSVAAERQLARRSADVATRAVDESAQAAKYAHCMQLTKLRPAEGESFAAAWQRRGGG